MICYHCGAVYSRRDDQLDIEWPHREGCARASTVIVDGSITAQHIMPLTITTEQLSIDGKDLDLG